MFKIGEYVVYGMNGVCRVEDIGPMPFGEEDNDKQYYTLMPLYTKGSTVFTPVDNKKVKIRPVISKNEAKDLIREMSRVETITTEDDKKRELAYKEALKSCDCREWMRIIRTVYKRKEERQAQGKKMSACDERYLKQAQDSLYGEFAISLKLEKSEVEEYVVQNSRVKEMAPAS